MKENLSDNSQNKPIIVFTNFTDADTAIDEGLFLIGDINDHEGIQKINLNQKSGVSNFSVCSISLREPKMESLPNIAASVNFISNIECLCPTYAIFTEFKKYRNWEKYKAEYNLLLLKRKEQIKEWLKNLSNKVYILCSWEKTSGTNPSHRQLVYNAMKSSKQINEKFLVFYRDGSYKNLITKKTFGLGEVNFGLISPSGVMHCEYEHPAVTKLKRFMGTVYRGNNEIKMDDYFLGAKTSSSLGAINTIYNNGVPRDPSGTAWSGAINTIYNNSAQSRV